MTAAVPIPPDLAVALRGAGAMDAFELLPPTEQRALVRKVEGTKNLKTRERRVAETVRKVNGDED